MLSGIKLKTFPPRLGTRQRCLFLPLLFNIVLEALITTNRQEEEVKDIQIKNEEAKLSLSADGMILYTENPKDSTNKLLGLMNSVKSQDTKSIYRNLWYFYTLIRNYQTEEQAKCPLVDELVKKRWYTHTKEYYSAIKKNEILPSVTT